MYPINNNERPKILIVDDTAAHVQVMREVLNEDYQLYFAMSGEDGLRMATDVLPDLILLDILMPGIDGYSVCRSLKSDPITANIPVIFVSALGETEHEFCGLELGAIDYLHKPIVPAILQVRVKNHIELKKHRDRLSAASQIDGLTGLPNRRCFDQALKTEWLRARRNGYPLAFIMLDIDYFKAYNDGYGHLVGDDALRYVAEALQKCLNRPGDLIARIGGEEFACILPNTESVGAGYMAEALRCCIDKLNLSDAYSLASDHLTISCGVASGVPGIDIADVEALLNLADKALYQAKHQGRNCCVIANLKETVA